VDKNPLWLKAPESVAIISGASASSSI